MTRFVLLVLAALALSACEGGMEVGVADPLEGEGEPGPETCVGSRGECMEEGMEGEAEQY